MFIRLMWGCIAGVLACGCSAPSGEKVYRGKDALAFLDTFVAEHKRILDSLRDKPYRLEWSRTTDDLTGHSAKRVQSREEFLEVHAGDDLYIKTKQDKEFTGKKRDANIAEHVEAFHLATKEFIYVYNLLEGRPCPVNRFFRTEKSYEDRMHSQLRWRDIGFGDVFSSLEERRSLLEGDSSWTMDVLEEAPSPPRTLPLYHLRFYESGRKRPDLTVTVDPERNYMVTHSRQLGPRGDVTDIEILLRRCKTLPNEPWFPAGWRSTEYGRATQEGQPGPVVHTSVADIPTFEFDIDLPKDYFSVKLFNIPDGNKANRELGAGRFERLAYFKGDFLPEDVVKQLMNVANNETKEGGE